MSKATKSTDIMKEVMEKMAADRKDRTTRAELNKVALANAVKPLGVTRIEVEFSGSSDSGQVDEIHYYVYKTLANNADTIKKTLVQEAKVTDSTTWSEAKKEWVTTTKCPTIEELVEQICYDLLSANHGGWEINEGSYGEFVFSFGKSNKIDLTFNQRIESVETSEETY